MLNAVHIISSDKFNKEQVNVDTKLDLNIIINNLNSDKIIEKHING